MSYDDPTLISAADIARTEMIAQISKDRSQQWRGLLSVVLRLSISEDERHKSMKAQLSEERKAFRNIRNLTKKLFSAIDALTIEQKITLGRSYYGAEINSFANYSKEFASHVALLKNSTAHDNAFLDGVAAYINATLAMNSATSPREGTYSRTPVRCGNRHLDAFDFLVTTLIRAAHFCGGRLECSKENPETPLNQMLDVIRPYLPKGIVPPAPSQRRLNDLYNHARKGLSSLGSGEELSQE